MGFSGGALSVHDDGVECLAFAEVDEVVYRCLIRVQLDKVFQTLRRHGRGDTSIERAEFLGFAVPLLAIQLDKAAGGFGDAASGNLRDNLPKCAPSSVMPPPTSTKYCGTALPPTLRTLPWKPSEPM